MGFEIYLPTVMGYVMENSHGLWVMDYGSKNTANELRKPKNVWVMRGYGLYLVWVIRGSTVMDMWLHESEFLIPWHPIPSQNLSVL